MGNGEGALRTPTTRTTTPRLGGGVRTHFLGAALAYPEDVFQSPLFQSGDGGGTDHAAPVLVGSQRTTGWRPLRDA